MAVIDDIRQALISPFSNLSTEDIKGLLQPQQTKLQAGLLGALQGIQPYMGWSTTPVSLGQAAVGALTGAAGGLQQKQESDLTRALQGLQLYSDLQPDELTGKAQEIAFYKARGFSDEDSQDLAYGRIQVNYNPDRKVWSKINIATGEVTEIGGPVSGATTTTTTGGITEGTTTGEPTTEITQKFTPSLSPSDLTPDQIKEFKMNITDVESVLPKTDEIISSAENIFGIEAKFKRGMSKIAGIVPGSLDSLLIDPKVIKSTQNYLTWKKEVERVFVNNPRFPEGETKRVGEILLDESSWLQDPKAAAIAIKEVKDIMQESMDKAKIQLGMTPKETNEIQGTGSSIDPYILSKPEDIMNYKSGDFVFWQGQIIQVN